MPDEPDAQLLRSFAQANEPLADAQFVAQITARLAGGGVIGTPFEALGSVLQTIGRSLLTGVTAPLRLRHVGVMALAALAVTVWAAFA
jgi:hypothetical protein